jgi:hypothetical protein
MNRLTPEQCEVEAAKHLLQFIMFGETEIPLNLQPKDLLGPNGKPLRAGDIKAGYTYVVDRDGRVLGHTGHNRKQRRASASKAKTR